MAFCKKCSGTTEENESCPNCEKEEEIEKEQENNYYSMIDDSPCPLGIGINLGFWMPENRETRPRIMMMSSVFPARDPRSREGGYSFQIHPSEFQAKSKKRPEKVHIHVWKGIEGREGNLRVYLMSLEVEEVDRGIPFNKWGNIQEFVRKNLTDIKKKVKEELKKYQLDYLVD